MRTIGFVSQQAALHFAALARAASGCTTLVRPAPGKDGRPRWLVVMGGAGQGTAPTLPLSTIRTTPGGAARVG